MKPENNNLKQQNKLAFTLLELLVAMVILTIATSIAFQAFSGTIRGWKRGMEVVDGIKHGDFAMSHLASALNSTIYFHNPRKTYAFNVEQGNHGGLPADEISFVTSSGAFMHHDSPFAKGPHRLRLFITDDEYGDAALYATAMPAVADEEEVEEEFDMEPQLVSRAVEGLEIFFWDKELEDWTDEWEHENSIPQRIMINLYVASANENEEPIVFTRHIVIPVYESVTARLKGPSQQQQGRR